jgi:hypothetical protein
MVCFSQTHHGAWMAQFRQGIAGVMYKEIQADQGWS